VTTQKSCTGIDFHRDAIEIDAAIVAEGLGVVASHVSVLFGAARSQAFTSEGPDRTWGGTV
jgi:hypothetical protein